MNVVTANMGSKVCLILGTGCGIGYSVAKKWAEKGHKVIITRRSNVSQEDLEKEVGAGVVTVQCDVTDKGQVHMTIDKRSIMELLKPLFTTLV